MLSRCACAQFFRPSVGLQHAAVTLDTPADTRPRGLGSAAGPPGLQRAAVTLDTLAGTPPRGLCGAAGPPGILSDASIEGPHNLGDVDECNRDSDWPGIQMGVT